MTTSFKGQLTTVESICQFLFAGNATVTLRSLKSGARFTYRVEESDDGKAHFVKLLIGGDNEGDYQYLGHFRLGQYSHGRKSRINAGAPSAVAFMWFAAKLLANELPKNLEVWHEGRCGHCNRKLTVPESVATGFGPDCSEKLGIARVACVETIDSALALDEERKPLPAEPLDNVFAPHPAYLATQRRYRRA